MRKKSAKVVGILTAVILAIGMGAASHSAGHEVLANNSGPTVISGQ
ncbi:hypothetical protein AB0N07_11645 [Streptomyces sp. NPDC051172]